MSIDSIPGGCRGKKGKTLNVMKPVSGYISAYRQYSEMAVVKSQGKKPIGYVGS